MLKEVFNCNEIQFTATLQIITDLHSTKESLPLSDDSHSISIEKSESLDGSVPPLSYLTFCGSTKSNTCFANALPSAFSESAL
jgi:hypothetical protein